MVNCSRPGLFANRMLFPFTLITQPNLAQNILLNFQVNEDSKYKWSPYFMLLLLKTQNNTLTPLGHSFPCKQPILKSPGKRGILGSIAQTTRCPSTSLRSCASYLVSKVPVQLHLLLR